MEGDAVFPETGRAVEAAFEPIFSAAFGLFGTFYIAALLHGAVHFGPEFGRFSLGADGALAIAEIRVGQAHDGKESEDIADGAPAVLEGHGHVLGHEAGEHKRADDDHEDKGDLQEIFQGSS